MKSQDAARFEFRRFGGGLAPFKDVFAALGPGAAQPASRETYIVTRLNVEANVKIRARSLEVKGLEGQLHGLQLWRPILQASFPVPARDVENVMAPALGIDVELGATAPLTEPALLELVAAEPALATIVIDKARTLFDLGDCMAEFCELRIGDDPLQTIAAEGAHVEAARAFLQRVGLEGLQNESYPAFLHKRLFPALNAGS
jgi:hypothetical protein